MSWAEKELGQAQLGDSRLSQRLVTLATRLAEAPSANLPQACRGWAEVQAAYRFLSQDKVRWQDILQPHWDASLERIKAHPVVLCLQDTTELDFKGKSTEGLGPLSYEAQRGMYLHPTYAVTPAREPLGVLDAWMWSRELKDPKTGKRPGQRESLRWVEGYARIAEQAAALPESRLIYVADREGDIVELMRLARDLDHPADWLIRSQHDRSLGCGAPKLSQALQDAPVLGQIRFHLSARRGQPARDVRQDLRVLRTTLPDGQHGEVDVNVVLASEVDAPKGVNPIQWRLLTNREIVTLDDAVTLVDWYRARWEIEMLFNILKTGCRVEALQLESIERLERALAVYLVVSWRIGWLMRLGRECPDLDAHLVFSPRECQAAFALNHKRPPAHPTINQVVRMIAMLGGYLGRKHDGEPGAKTLWQGLQVLNTAVAAFDIMDEMRSQR
jgi:hypothetical protein